MSHSVVTRAALFCIAGCSSHATVPEPCVLPDTAPELDSWGGLAAETLPHTTLFTVGSWHGASWLVDPDGHPFFSFGIAVTGPQGDVSPATGMSPYAITVAASYASDAAWAAATVTRLAQWGLNTLGAWSDSDLFAMGPTRVPYTVILDLGRPPSTTNMVVPDYFDPAFATNAALVVTTLVTPHLGDPWLVGYFLDNELHWGPDQNDTLSLLDDYMALPGTAPGKQHVVDALLALHGGDVQMFDATWGTTFASRDDMLAPVSLPALASDAMRADRSAIVRQIADQYFAVTIAAVRAVDADHLILGSRFVSWLLPAEVLASAAAAPLDIVSVNHYEFTPFDAKVAQGLSDDFVKVGPGIDAIVAGATHPVMISEFAYRAADSGLPNTEPILMPVLDTQAERADSYEDYARAQLAMPQVLGLHWFQWVDEPATGRFDGENSNWGLVTTGDVAYEPLVDRMTCIAARVVDLHSN